MPTGVCVDPSHRLGYLLGAPLDLVERVILSSRHGFGGKESGKDVCMARREKTRGTPIVYGTEFKFCGG